MANQVVDIVGKKFGKLTVIKRFGYTNGGKRKYITWLCKCDCGNEVLRTASHLKSGYNSCCDFCNRNISEDLTGMVFGRWTVLKRAENHKRQKTYLCRCSCGTERVVLSKSLINGASVSCGCYQKEVAKERIITHGLTNTRIYHIYHGMIQRCYNQNDSRYKDYGGRGIKVCDEWFRSFESFYNWSLHNGYCENLTIDRMNNDGDYCPNNCRWATKYVQSNNRRDSIKFTFFGVTKNLKEWCDCIGENYRKMYARHYRGCEVFRGEDLEKIEEFLKNGGV